MRLLGRNRIKDPVQAEGRVVEMEPTAKAARQTGKLDVEYRFRLQVTLPGRPPYDVEHEEQVPHAKMPVRGDVLPVTVSQAEPARLRIE
jgi:hypothetical protein